MQRLGHASNSRSMKIRAGCANEKPEHERQSRGMSAKPGHEKEGVGG